MQVTLCGSWKLCTSLPFALEAQLVFTQYIDKPWTQKQELHKNQPQQLSLTPGTSVPSIIAADNELAGVQVRISGVQDGWSIVYPLNSTAHDWNKPQLLAEVRLRLTFSVLFLEISAKRYQPNVCSLIDRFQQILVKQFIAGITSSLWTQQMDDLGETRY